MIAVVCLHARHVSTKLWFPAATLHNMTFDEGIVQTVLMDSLCSLVDCAW